MQFSLAEKIVDLHIQTILEKYGAKGRQQKYVTPNIIFLGERQVTKKLLTTVAWVKKLFQGLNSLVVFNATKKEFPKKISMN